MTQGKKTINITLKVWRQKGPKHKGRLETIPVKDIPTDMSFLEMLDVVNERLTLEGKEPIEFDNDCREGICGMCGAVVNGIAHGPEKGMTLCQLHMRKFSDGDTIVVEPWRSRAFPIVKDLIVDRSALDKIIQAGGFVSMVAGGAPDANAIPISQEIAEKAMDAAACIGCGACMQVCPTAAIRIEDLDGVRRTVITGTVVQEQPLLACSECGAPTRTPAHRNFVRDRLPDHMATLLDRELCPSCARLRTYRPNAERETVASRT